MARIFCMKKSVTVFIFLTKVKNLYFNIYPLEENTLLMQLKPINPMLAHLKSKPIAFSNSMIAFRNQEQISSDFNLVFNEKSLFLWIILVPNICDIHEKIWYMCISVNKISQNDILHQSISLLWQELPWIKGWRDLRKISEKNKSQGGKVVCMCDGGRQNFGPMIRGWEETFMCLQLLNGERCG